MAAAEHLAESAEFDIAIVDINLAGHEIWPIAEAIGRRGAAFLSSLRAVIVTSCYRRLL
ncbi:hypothetical protein [Bradyrhizobium sp.]|uniref:hypothetical protein n=1 Tax=Bradyrhizobium sp. TaxID=376 RepID=UPI0025C20C85|nr:hypothetical protein [Bradyrhizobium sp.]